MVKVANAKAIGAAVLSLAGVGFGVKTLEWYNGSDRERATNDPDVTFKLKQIDLPHTGNANRLYDVVTSPDTGSQLEFHFKNTGTYVIQVDVMYSKKVNWFADRKFPGGSAFVMEDVHPGEVRTHSVPGDFSGIEVTRVPVSEKDASEWFADSPFMRSGARH